MSVRTDVINLNVNINGNQSQNALNELRKKAADYAFELKGMKKGTQEFIDKSTELRKVNAEMDSLKKQIGLSALSIKELGNERKKLTSIMNSAVPGTKEFKDYENQLKKVIARQQELQGSVRGAQNTFGSLTNSLKGLGAAYFGTQFFTSVIKDTGKLSDNLADIQRVTGLTTIETKALNDELKKLDTRTSVEGLQNIVVIAGKLGVAKQDVFEFTKAVDKLVVALGDELGDASQITEQLGKILNVFDGKVNGDNITRLGNAFVELANTGAASGGFIADFDQRLSGIAKSAGIGLGALSGLGAGLEELGGRVESSSTAIQKLIGSVASDLPAAAKIAGKSTAEFTALFGKDPVEALLQYAQGLVKNKESFADITKAFKDAGEEGARTIETITKLGTSADYLRGRVNLGTKSIQEFTSIEAAFELKNKTFGAELDKVGKKFDNLKLSIGEKLIPVFDIFLDRAQQATDAISGLFSADKWKADLDDFWQALKTFDGSEIWRSFAHGAAKKESTPFVPGKIPLVYPGAFGQGIPQQIDLVGKSQSVAASDLFGKTDKGLKKTVETAKKAIVDLHAEYKKFIKDLQNAVAEGKLTKGMDDLTLAVVKIDKEIDGEEEKLKKFLKDKLITRKQYDADFLLLQEKKALELQKLLKKYPALNSDPSYAIGQSRDNASQPGIGGTIGPLGDRLPGAGSAIGDRNITAQEVALMRARGNARLKEQLKLFDLEKAQKLSNTKLTEDEVALIEKEYADKSEQAAADHFHNISRAIIGAAQTTLTAVSGILEIISNREQAAFNKEKRVNDEKIKLYKKQLDGKLLSQAQYEKKVQAIQEAQDKKRHEMELKQAKRQKTMALIQAIIDTASAVTEALPNIPLSIIAGVMGAIQIGIIASQPLPELAEGYWFKKGKKHKDGGIDVNIEKDEAVMNAASMTDDTVVTATGTTAQITSALNSRKGGVNWAGGATVIDMPAWRRQLPAQINPNMHRIMADGGYAGKAASQKNNDEQTGLLRQLIDETKETREELKRWKTKIKGEWYYKDFDEGRAKLEQAKKASGFDQ